MHGRNSKNPESRSGDPGFLDFVCVSLLRPFLPVRVFQNVSDDDGRFDGKDRGRNYCVIARIFLREQ